MFRQLDYQDKVLTTFDAYLDLLKAKKREADQVAELAALNPHLKLPISDFAREAWDALKADGKLPASRVAIPFSERRDGCDRPVPNVVLKVPTGGGKTWLAVTGVSRIICRYLSTNTGFVLWIVPSEAIYTQTLKNLNDRQHPYRQALDRTAAGRVRIMEKTDRLDARDINSNLCVMLLMLQSANRQSKETLKLFRDRGDVHGFFPAEGEQHAHKAALEETPNLDAYNDMYPMVKDSLGNALRTIRPVVVLDEGHRAISELAFETLYGFNPCFVLELTATPRDVQPRGGRNPRPGRNANVLVEVTGKELDREGMIKMPLNLDSRQGSDWRVTLNSAISKLDELDHAAKKLQANHDRYIRPIMLVQVERTGGDQRESGFIHAEDVRELLLVLGFDKTEIAIKTAEQNDLKQPENQNLLSPSSPVRVIVTKQALQEGWDCPFAYVLCALAANNNLNAMTQLVGRILRQPHAMKTDIDALDQCHVITHHANTASVVGAIKNGLERDGLGDFVLQLAPENTEEVANVSRRVRRRHTFHNTNIYLPKVMQVQEGEVRDLDYETDILSRIDWRGYDPERTVSKIPENAQAAESQLQRIQISEYGDELIVGETVAQNMEVLNFDPAYAVRMTIDIVPNPFVGREIIARLINGLRKRGFDDRKIGRLSALIIEELRRELDAERNRRAEAFFKREVSAGRIQFRLWLDGRDWQMPFTIETMEPDNARQIVGKSGGPLEKSLFAPVYEAELNSDERDVAVYLDGEGALAWWHRNVARKQYGIQGWRKAKIYPDFIFAVDGAKGAKRITILETKGDQLDNLDTAYKRDVLNILSTYFEWHEHVRAGCFTLEENSVEIVQGTLILMSEMNSKLPDFLR